MPASTKVSTEPLVDFPAQHSPPERVVRELRRIDPDVDLVYFGEGRWLLGSVSPHPYRQGLGRRMLKNARMLGIGDESARQADRIKLSHLIAQGFRPIKMYRYERGAGGPDHRLVDDFARRDRNYRMHFEEELAEREREIDGTEHEEQAVETLMEAARAKAADIGKYVFRKARNVTIDGLRDDPGAPTTEEATDG